MTVRHQPKTDAHQSTEEETLMQLSFSEYTNSLKPILDMKIISAMNEKQIDAAVQTNFKHYYYDVLESYVTH